MNTYVESIISDLSEQWRPIVLPVLENCKSSPRGEDPFNEDEMNRTAYEVAKAISDCAALDSWTGDDFFSARFRAGLLDPRAYAGLAWQILDEPDKRKLKPLIAAMKEGPDSFEMARAIHDLREHVRDGVPIAQSIALISARMPGIAGYDGAVQFYMKTLPDAIREITTKPQRYERGVRGWIKRAWIPLALWLDVNYPQKTHCILDRARKCYPPARSIRFEYQADFLPAWSKIKPTKGQQVSRLPKG